MQTNNTVSSHASTMKHRSTDKGGHNASDRTPASHPLTGRWRTAKRILLVDDDPSVRDSLKDVFAGEGYRVIPAGNGQDALDLLTRLPVDLAVLDLNMPVKNGWDTFHQLTFEHPLIPIIIITARANQLFTAIGAGTGAALGSPMDIPLLLLTMAKRLTESAAQTMPRLAGKESGVFISPQ